MLSKAIFYFIITFVSTSCETSNILTSSKQDHFPSIFGKVVDVLNLCFEDTLNPLITTTDVDERIYPFPGKLQSASIILINNYFQLNNARNFNTKLSRFLITIYSKQYLNSTLMTISSSPWWNGEASFFVIGASDGSCVDAFDVLMRIWKKKVLSVVYFCYCDGSDSMMMYTFNPFTHHAPEPWKIATDREPDDPWTLYYQHFEDSGDLCKNLMFDKTKYLNGYHLRVVTNKPIHISQAAKTQPYNLKFLLQRTPLPYRAILPAVFDTSNLSLSIYDGDLGWLDNGKLSGCLVNLSKGEYDIYLQQRPLYFEYPHKTILFLVTDIAMLSTKSPFLKAEEKILSLCQLNVFILICFVILITTLVLKSTQKQDLTEVFLNILRIFLYTSILQPLRTCSIRIYFFGIFWLIVIINGTFEGKLSSFLTKPDRHLVESIDDVIKYQYHLYISIRLVDRYKDLLSAVDSKHMHIHNTIMCGDEAVNDTRTVCVGEASTLVKFAEKKYHLYVSMPIDQISIVWLTSPDFSLVGKINTQLFRCIESGLMKLWYDQGYPNQRKKMLAIEAAETRAQYRPIQLNDILFAFKLFFIGLVFSCVVFIMEINNR